jgi:uncharacterized membrane protein YfcA
MIELDLAHWALAIVVVFIGSAIQGVIGFGVGLFSAPLLFLIHPALVPAPLIIIGGILPLLVWRANARAVVPRDLAYALPAGLVGVIAAYLLAGMMTAATWQWVFGLTIILAVVVSVMRFNIQPNPPAICIGSFFSGCMGTISGVGGPPLGVAFQHAEPARVRGTLSAIFVPMSVMALTALYFLDRLGWREVWLAAAMLPAVFGGFWFARRFGARVPRKTYRAFVLGTAFVAGVYAVVRGML